MRSTDLALEWIQTVCHSTPSLSSWGKDGERERERERDNCGEKWVSTCPSVCKKAKWDHGPSVLFHWAWSTHTHTRTRTRTHTHTHEPHLSPVLRALQIIISEENFSQPVSKQSVPIWACFVNQRASSVITGVWRRDGFKRVFRWAFRRSAVFIWVGLMKEGFTVL